MSSEAIRINSGTLRSLRGRSRETGEPVTRLAQRYIEEGMRSERHPDIVFRSGPVGRRASVAGGPDVWEIIAAARSTPETGEGLVLSLAEGTGITPSRIRAAIRYYAEYPSEVEELIARNEVEAERLETILDRERSLIG